MAAVEKVLADMEARGHRYFEDTLRIGRVIDLLNRARVQKEFEDKRRRRRAAADRAAGHRADRLAGRSGFPPMAGGDEQAGRAPAAARRRGCSARPTSAAFTTIARRLIDSVGREAQRVVDTYDKQREAEVIADQARVAVAAAAAAGGAARRARHARDDRGVDGRGRRDRHPAGQRGARRRVPDHPARRRRRRRRRSRRRWPRLRDAARRRRCGPSSRRAREQSAQRLRDAVAPYARFVHAEERRWAEAQQTLDALGTRIAALLDVGSEDPALRQSRDART